MTASENWLPITDYLKLPNVCCVYLIRNTVNGKEYVGKTSNLRRRMKAHCEVVDEARYIYRSILKHGIDKFVCRILLEGTEEEMNAAEIAAIASRNTYAPAGYNMTLGGDGSTGYKHTPEDLQRRSELWKGRKHTEETKALMRAARLANNHRKGTTVTDERREQLRQQAIARNTGRVASEETRKKMSESIKALDLSCNRKTVLLWEQDSLIPREFVSSTALAEYLDMRKSTVCNWLKERNKPKIPIALCYE